MAKYLTLNSNGDQLEVNGTATSAGAADAGKIPQLNGAGQIDPSMIPTVNTITFTASEAIAAGALVNVYDSGAGVMKIRNATNTGAGTRADGYAVAAIAANASGPVMLSSGLISGLSGLTPGARYLLGVGGGVVTVPPTSAGTIVQSVGVAKSATELSFLAGGVTVRA